MASRHKDALVQRPWGESLLTTVSLCVWLESRSSGVGGDSQGRRIGQKMHLIGVSSYLEGNGRPLMNLKLGGDRMMSLFLQ